MSKEKTMAEGEDRYQAGEMEYARMRYWEPNN